MKKKIHSSIIEGILFCGSGLGLLSYSLISYGRAFNKDWGQSPYLFPMLVGLALTGLSIWLIGEGILAAKREASQSGTSREEAAQAEMARERGAESGDGDGKGHGTGDEAVSGPAERCHGRQIRWVVTALLLCMLYYLALAWIRLPYITVGILSFFYTFSTFEVVTILFLAAMMLFMGVRKLTVLLAVPLGATLFLSIAFRTLLHVLLP